MNLYTIVVAMSPAFGGYMLRASCGFQDEDDAKLWANGLRIGSDGNLHVFVLDRTEDDPENEEQLAGETPAMRQLVREECKRLAEKLKAEGWTIPQACGHYYSYRLCGDEDACHRAAWGL